MSGGEIKEAEKLFASRIATAKRGSGQTICEGRVMSALRVVEQPVRRHVRSALQGGTCD